MNKRQKTSRRSFIKNAAMTGIAINLVPSGLLSGGGRKAPGERLNIALVGCGTQGIKMLIPWLEREDLQFIATCDPNRESSDYPQWGRPKGEKEGFKGGREAARSIINNYYASKNNRGSFKGCNAYADFHELLEKEKDLDAVFVLTPDHLHATIAVAAMKKNICVGSHKPISNFMYETRLACNTARSTGVQTQLFAWMDHIEKYSVAEWIRQGVIGKVKELHRWTNRPVWPQGSPSLPTNNPPVPEGFDWDLWLGPSLPRPYSPDYTHTVFRGWYEFGAGCLADMGYYGFWEDWRLLNLGMPLTAEGNSCFTCEIKDFRSGKVENKVSFPYGATLLWEVPVQGTNDMMDVYWYEGGIKPQTPKELSASGEKLPAEGVLFMGEKGMILAGYMYQNPKVIGSSYNAGMISSIKIPEVMLVDQMDEMAAAFMGGKPSRGSFENAQTIAEAICLGNLAIRTGQRLIWDNSKMEVTNYPEANVFLKREYRPGWEL